MLLVCVLGLFLGAGLIADCGDGCSPACGDCAACLVSGPLPERPDVAAPRAQAARHGHPVRVACPLAAHRPIEHVPLLLTA